MRDSKAALAEIAEGHRLQDAIIKALGTFDADSTTVVEREFDLTALAPFDVQLRLTLDGSPLTTGPILIVRRERNSGETCSGASGLSRKRPSPGKGSRHHSRMLSPKKRQGPLP